MTSLMLEDSNLPENVIESMSVVMTSARLLLTLINNMLDVRKCDSAMMDEFQLSPLRLSQALSSAVDFCKPFAGITGVGLSVANFADLKQLHVKSNGLRFQQVMINLISNAIKYSPTGSSVAISVKEMTLSEAEGLAARALARGLERNEANPNFPGSTRVAVVSVTDYGAGIPEEKRSHMFGRFAQLDTKPTNFIGGESQGQPSGTGLGLNLCLKFVQRMQGNIWVENNTDCGSTFSFYLQIAEATRERKSTATAKSIRSSSPTAVTEATSADRFHVLVVDDTIINLKVLERILKRIGVGKVTCASSARKGLEELEKDHYNLVFTDLQMPEMGGIDLTKIIIGKDRKQPVPPMVVGLTAEVSDSVDAQCKAVGMAHVLHKPITATQMQEFFDSMAGKASVLCAMERVATSPPLEA